MKKTLSLLSIILLAIVSSCSNKQAGKEISSGDLYSDEEQAVLGRGIVSYPGNRDQVPMNWRLFPDDPKESLSTFF